MRRFTRSAAILVGICAIVSSLFFLSGARINTTKSIAVGLYWTSQKPIEKGSYVQFCPPKDHVFDDAKARGYIGAGYCPGGYGYMMKRVLAAKKDSVTVSKHGVWVNGEMVPFSVPVAADGANRPMPLYRVKDYVLKMDELLLMSDVTALSFDGRYYGLIARKQVETVLTPIFTW